jgi:hypothetical protein
MTAIARVLRTAVNKGNSLVELLHAFDYYTCPAAAARLEEIQQTEERRKPPNMEKMKARLIWEG